MVSIKIDVQSFYGFWKDSRIWKSLGIKNGKIIVYDY